MGNKYLVLDIGGSSIKYALMTECVEFLEKGKVIYQLEDTSGKIKKKDTTK